MRRLSYGQAISEATVQCMEADPSIFVAGIGVDDFKGIFGTTFEAHRRFGTARVFDIPKAAGSAEKGVPDVQATFAGPY